LENWKTENQEFQMLTTLWTNAFHSSADLGCVFQPGCNAPIKACISGLAVSGTGISWAGTSRVLSNAVAEPIATAVVTNNKVTSRVGFIFLPPNETPIISINRAG
jgi:hypothetical protein